MSDYSLDDVSCKFTEAELKQFEPENPGAKCHRTGWAMNIRRRVYDTLNVLYASNLLAIEQKDDRFKINPDF